ncbi:hypothetical protein JW824_09075 [bacterium]|nr:hypothetical protein [bacterium]
MLTKRSFLNIRDIICFLLILCLFSHCAAPGSKQNIRRWEEIESNDSIQESDSLQIFITNEDIKREMKWRIKEHIGSYLVGLVFGTVVGMCLGAGATYVIAKPGTGGGEGLAYLPGIVIGGLSGSIAGSLISHKVIYDIEKKGAQKRLLVKQKQEMQIEFNQNGNNKN